MTNGAEVQRLILEIERGVLARAQLNVLVAAADATIAGQRQALRNLKAQIARDSRKTVRST